MTVKKQTSKASDISQPNKETLAAMNEPTEGLKQFNSAEELTEYLKRRTFLVEMYLFRFPHKFHEIYPRTIRYNRPYQLFDGYLWFGTIEKEEQ